MDADVYGPALPPGFNQIEDTDTLSPTSEVDKGNPPLKPTGVIGPQLPPEFVKGKNLQTESSDDNDDDDDDEKVLDCGSKSVIGPALPPGFSMSQAEDYTNSDSDFESDAVYGPLPATDKSESVDDVIASIEKRATNMRKKLEEADKPVVKVSQREEWMTLPATDYKNQFGIISRCLVDDDKPESSNKRTAKKISQEESHHSAQDEQLKEELEKYNKAKRAKSLLELHKKSRKQKKDKESNKPKERKAFDRDAELGLRLMDQRQVNSVIRNAKKLNSRFASGASQYL